MTRFGTLALVASTMLVAAPSSAQRPVGFMSFTVMDSSRTWERPSVTPSAAAWRPRPVRISVWYPARTATGSSMRVGDYLTHSRFPSDSESTRRLDQRDSATFVRQVLDGDASLLPAAANIRVSARRNATAIQARAPLLLYSAGLNSFDTDNAFLAESLATHGFVVVTVAQQGVASDRLELSIGAADVETQVRDLELALAVMRRRSNVDDGRIGVVGWSMGAVAGLLLISRHPEVRAFAALDPSFDYRNHPSRISASPWFATERVTLPILVVEQHSADATDAIIDSLSYAPRDVVRYPGVVHEDFAVGAVISASVGTRWARRSPGHAVAAYHDAMARVVAFMDAHLNNGGTTTSKVPAANSFTFPAGSIVERHLVAAGPIIGPSQLALEIERHGYAPALALLRAASAPRVREAELNSFAYELLGGPRQGTAVFLFRLNTELFAGSANAFDSLADGLRAINDPAGAAQAHRRVLALVDTDTTITAETRETLRVNAARFLTQYERQP